MISGGTASSASFDVSAEEACETHDAIVVGAGAAGSLAAYLLSGAGLRTLVLDAGYTPPISRAPFRRALHSTMRVAADPRLMRIIPPRLVGLGRRGLRVAGGLRQPVQLQCYAWERAPDLFVDDLDNPYTTPADMPFTWIRARGLGGRMSVPGHGRQFYRMSAEDFAPGDELSPAWPLASGELDRWYDLVEKLLSLHGRREHVASVPDSLVATETEPTSAEERAIDLVRGRWPACDVMLGRYAPPGDLLAKAAGRGDLRTRRGAIAVETLIDARGVRGIRWIDQERGRAFVSRAPLVCLAASALESTRLLMLSRDAAGRSLGRSLPALGSNLMDHVMTKIEGHLVLDEPVPALEDGRCVYLPRFDRRRGDRENARGFGIQLYQYAGVGRQAYVTAVAFGEMLPRARNRVMLDPQRKDRWGVPVLRIECEFGDDERRRAREQNEALRELADVLGAKIRSHDPAPFPPGTAAHECGTARMGLSPDESVLTPFSDVWGTPGLYVIDGAAFPSQGIQNPTLTILALTARACDHALRARGGNGLVTDDVTVAMQ